MNYEDFTMIQEKDLPKRKSTRLKNFDYSTVGAYFVTICVRDRMPILSEIAVGAEVGKDETGGGRGGACSSRMYPPSRVHTPSADFPEITLKLKPCGEIVKEQLELLENRFPSVTIDGYVIMPDHIHAVIFIHETTCGEEEKGGVSVTLDDVICAFKSLTSRICKQRCGIEKIFQRSYAEHIVRDKNDYETHMKYIYENPMRRYYKQLEGNE